MDGHVKFNKSESLEKRIERKKLRNTGPNILLNSINILLLDPIDIKITLSNDYKGF